MPITPWASPASSPQPDLWAAIEARLRAVLSKAYAAAWSEGTALTTDDALGWAGRTRGPSTRPVTGWQSLTPTEVKLAQLVAEWLTNPQVGERMFISRETVRTHLGHGFGTLGVNGRVELAVCVVRRKRGVPSRAGLSCPASTSTRPATFSLRQYLIHPLPALSRVRTKNGDSAVGNSNGLPVLAEMITPVAPVNLPVPPVIVCSKCAG